MSRYNSKGGSMKHEILPGCRVIVFDSTLFKNDKETPLSITRKSATVTCRYGKLKYDYGDFSLGPYEDLIDVVFDHRLERISHGHFLDGVEHICEGDGK